MTTKTYSAKGLMEWQCQIVVGKTLMHVPFTGGTQTGYGVTPAKYTTSDPVIQAVIEHSDYYRRGRITLLGSKGDTPQAVRVTGGDGISSRPVEEKTFSTLGDAKAWLTEKYGVASSSLRTIQDAVTVAKSHNVALAIGEKK